MSKLFIPCYEHCFIRYGKQYTEECDTTCDYAKVCLKNKELKAEVEKLKAKVEELKEDCNMLSYEPSEIFNYKMPQEIKEKFTIPFMMRFFANLVRIFDLIRPLVSYSEDISHLEGSCGWVDAFKETCMSYEMCDIWEYYDGLMWYDSDLFDYELGELLVEYGLVKD